MADGSPGHYSQLVYLTIPANTAAAAPAVVAYKPPITPYVLEELEVRFPAGVRGLAGFNLLYQGAAIVPWGQPGVFYVSDDEVMIVPVDQTLSGPLTIQGVNADTSYAHTLELRFRTVDPTPTSPAATPTAVVPIS